MVRLRHPLVAVGAVVLLTLPWVGLWLTGGVASLSTGAVIVASGVLCWAPHSS